MLQSERAGSGERSCSCEDLSQGSSHRSPMLLLNSMLTESVAMVISDMAVDDQPISGILVSLHASLSISSQRLGDASESAYTARMKIVASLMIITY